MTTRFRPDLRYMTYTNVNCSQISIKNTNMYCNVRFEEPRNNKDKLYLLNLIKILRKSKIILGINLLDIELLELKMFNVLKLLIQEKGKVLKGIDFEVDSDNQDVLRKWKSFKQVRRQFSIVASQKQKNTIRYMSKSLKNLIFMDNQDIQNVSFHRFQPKKLFVKSYDLDVQTFESLRQKIKMIENNCSIVINDNNNHQKNQTPNIIQKYYAKICMQNQKLLYQDSFRQHSVSLKFIFDSSDMIKAVANSLNDSEGFPNLESLSIKFTEDILTFSDPTAFIWLQKCLKLRILTFWVSVNEEFQKSINSFWNNLSYLPKNLQNLEIVFIGENPFAFSLSEDSNQAELHYSKFLALINSLNLLNTFSLSISCSKSFKKKHLEYMQKLFQSFPQNIKALWLQLNFWIQKVEDQAYFNNMIDLSSSNLSQLKKVTLRCSKLSKILVYPFHYQWRNLQAISISLWTIDQENYSIFLNEFIGNLSESLVSFKLVFGYSQTIEFLEKILVKLLQFKNMNSLRLSCQQNLQVDGNQKLALLDIIKSLLDNFNMLYKVVLEFLGEYQLNNLEIEDVTKRIRRKKNLSCIGIYLGDSEINYNYD